LWDEHRLDGSGASSQSWEMLLYAFSIFSFSWEGGQLAYHLKSVQITLAGIITALISGLGDKTCAGIKLFFSQRDNALSNKVPISKCCPAVKNLAIATVLWSECMALSAGMQNYFIMKRHLKGNFADRQT
jgi:hypothetical protein